MQNFKWNMGSLAPKSQGVVGIKWNLEQMKPKTIKNIVWNLR